MKITNKDDQVTTPIRPDELDEWQAACDGATEGPWIARGEVVETEWGGPLNWGGDGEPTEASNKRDARFIALARTAVPRLIAEVRRLKAELRSKCLDNVSLLGEVQAENEEFEELRAEV